MQVEISVMSNLRHPNIIQLHEVFHESDHYYFAHGYVAAPDPADIVATTELDGRELPAAIGRDALLGVQFHPEKSGKRGLALIDRFCRC